MAACTKESILKEIESDEDIPELVTKNDFQNIDWKQIRIPRILI
ncbi:hypothetical protein [Cytobacillus purgationiresistens]|nr:hypothetical protein [Cytobacillus purgationiresistens]